uniref:Uncharacterized protein n=1 Tax=Anopheles funestus TaxID=62324 RepID=A0A182RCB6_ANOFN
MEQTTTERKGRNSFAALRNIFNVSKPATNDSSDKLPKPIKKSIKNTNENKNEKLNDPNVEQLDPEIPAVHLKPREEFVPEKETETSKGDSELVQFVDEASTLDIKPITDNSKTENFTESNFEQLDPEISAALSKSHDGDLKPEKETPNIRDTEPTLIENEVATTDIHRETEPTEFPTECVIKTIESQKQSKAIEMALDDLQTMDAKLNLNVSKIVIPNDLSTDCDQAKNISEDTDAVVDSTPNESQDTSILTAQDEPLQDHINVQEVHGIEQPIIKEQTDAPADGNNTVKEEMLQKKSPSSGMSLKEKHLLSSKSSQSSLYSSGPSSSSLCHLTELSQPKPEALRTTLMCLRQLHGKDAEHLVNIERHLRGLRTGAKTKSFRKTNSTNNNTTSNKSNKSTRPQTKLPETDDETALGERQALDKFAANLFAHFERKRAIVNYEVAKLQMPVEMGYYRAAYDALVTTFGQPYHKCTLELYQQLAGELGVGAEMFVMDKTPKIIKVNA